MSDTKLSPSATVLANLSANPDWLPTAKGEVRVVNTLIDDGKLTADWRGSGPRAVLVKLSITGNGLTPAERVANWISAPNDTAFVGAMVRGIRDGSITPDFIAEALKARKSK